MAPMIPTASTPAYIKSAASPSAPMRPTAPTTHTRINAVASAAPTAYRHAEADFNLIAPLWLVALPGACGRRWFR